MIKNETRKRKKLLVLTSTFPRWENDDEPPFVFELCRRLKDHFDVLVMAPHASGCNHEDSIDGIRVRRYRYFFEKWQLLAYRGGILANLKRNRGLYLLVPFFLAAQIIAVCWRLRNEEFDAVHAHWVIPQGLTCALGQAIVGKKYPPIICTSHGSDLLSLGGTPFRHLKRMALHRADAVTVVSDALKARALDLGVDERKLATIPMGVDAHTLFFPSPVITRSTDELLFVGRLVASKAVDTIIKAMPAILDAFPRAHLTIAGDGPERDRLENIVQDMHLCGHVGFLGAVENSKLPELYRRAAVFLSASRSEGFGLTLCEAAACECPVIAPDLPACREIVIDRETGLLVPPADEEAIARKAIDLLADPTLRQMLGTSARKLVLEKFDWKVIAPRYAKIIETAIAA